MLLAPPACATFPAHVEALLIPPASLMHLTWVPKEGNTLGPVPPGILLPLSLGRLTKKNGFRMKHAPEFPHHQRHPLSVRFKNKTTNQFPTKKNQPPTNNHPNSPTPVKGVPGDFSFSCVLRLGLTGLSCSEEAHVEGHGAQVALESRPHTA